MESNMRKESSRDAPGNSIPGEPVPPRDTTELDWDGNSVIMSNYGSCLRELETYVEKKKIGVEEEEEEEEKEKEKEKKEEGEKVLENCDFETAIMEAGYGKYNLLLLLSAFPGFYGCMNATGSTSLILPSAECDLELTSFDKGLVNSAAYVGMICCAFFWGFLSDVLGRKNIIVIVFLLDVISNVAVALSQNFPIFITAKLISGFITSGSYALLMTYLAECHASKYRASVLQWTGFFGALSSLISPAAAWLIVPQPINIFLFNGSMSLKAWRIYLLTCAIPSLIASILLSFFGESPKFLMSRGRNEEAMEVLKTMYSVNTGKPKDKYPVKSLAKEVDESKGKSVKLASVEKSLSQVKPLFHKPYLSDMSLAFAVHFLIVGGLNTMRLWAPQIFSTMIDEEKSSDTDYAPSTVCEILAPLSSNATETEELIHCTEHLVEPQVYINSMIVGSICGICYLFSGYIVAIFGKKLLIHSTLVLAGLCCIGMNWSVSSNIMMWLTSFFLTMTSVSSTTLISIIVDIIPTAQRSMALCLAMMFGRTGAMVGNLVFPLLLDWNCEILFFLLAGVIFGGAGLTFRLPVTKGAALK